MSGTPSSPPPTVKQEELIGTRTEREETSLQILMLKPEYCIKAHLTAPVFNIVSDRRGEYSCRFRDTSKPPPAEVLAEPTDAVQVAAPPGQALSPCRVETSQPAIGTTANSSTTQRKTLPKWP
jgi:hypothetical protein